MTQRYDLNDLQLEASYLSHILDTVADTITECHFGSADGRFPYMDRLQALIAISQDRARQLSQNVDTHFREIGSTCQRGQEVRDAA